MNNIDSFRNCGTPKEVEESKTQRNLPELTTKQKPRVEIQQNAAAAALATPPLIAASPSLSSASKSVTSTPFAMDFPVPTYTTTQLLSKKTEWLNQMNLFDTNKDMSCFDFDYSVRLINNIRFANGGDDTFCLCLCNMFEHNCNSCKKTNTKTYKNDRVFEPATFLVPRTSLANTKTNWTPLVKFHHPAIKSQLTTGSCDYLYQQLKQMIVFLQLYGGSTLNRKTRQHQKSLKPSRSLKPSNISIHSFVQAKKGLVSFGKDSSYYINEWAPKLVSGFLERLGGKAEMIEATRIFFSDTMITTASKLLKQAGFDEGSWSIPTSSMSASMPASMLKSMKSVQNITNVAPAAATSTKKKKKKKKPGPEAVITARDVLVESHSSSYHLRSSNNFNNSSNNLSNNISSMSMLDALESELIEFIPELGLGNGEPLQIASIPKDALVESYALIIEENPEDVAAAASRLIDQPRMTSIDLTFKDMADLKQYFENSKDQSSQFDDDIVLAELAELAEEVDNFECDLFAVTAGEICTSPGALHLILTTRDIDILEKLAAEAAQKEREQRALDFIENYCKYFDGTKPHKEKRYSVSISDDSDIERELGVYLMEIQNWNGLREETKKWITTTRHIRRPTGTISESSFVDLSKYDTAVSAYRIFAHCLHIVFLAGNNKELSEGKLLVIFQSSFYPELFGELELLEDPERLKTFIRKNEATRGSTTVKGSVQHCFRHMLKFMTTAEKKTTTTGSIKRKGNNNDKTSQKKAKTSE